MDDIAEKTMLYDFYGALLTDRQREIYENYYLNDLSLGEIAEELEISRAAVHDNLKRSEKALIRFEERLGLIQHFLDNQEMLKNIRKLTHETDGTKALKQIREMIDKVLKNL